MNFEYNNGIYTLKSEQILPITIHEAWLFFSDPGNLQRITPDDLNFGMSGDPDPMFAGQIITYRIKIFPFFSTNWVTEITHVEDHRCFIDEQRFGPYKLWHHRHYFVDLEDHVLMTDEVNFKLPFGILGRLAFKLFIKKKLTHIFSYRTRELDELFRKN